MALKKTEGVLRVSSPLAGAARPSIAEYARQHHALILVRHLSPLIISIQQHRGTSLALLEGDKRFKSQVDTLRNEISDRIDTIRQLNLIYNDLIPKEHLEEVYDQWEGFVSRPLDKDVTRNFEFHSHLINRLIQLIWLIVLDANHFFPSHLAAPALAGKAPLDLVNGEDAAAEKISDHHLIVQLVGKDLPQLIENIAKARGLSVHTAVIGTCDQTHHAELNYLLQTIGYKQEKIRTLYRGLHRDTLKKLPTLVATLLHEHKLAHLLQLIKQEVILPEQITIDGQQIFQLATEIVDIYSAIIGQAMDVIQNNLDAGLGV